MLPPPPLIFILILLTPVTTKDVKIINGTEAQTDEFLFMVSLQNNTTHFCGGTVLNKKFILTAAHCVCNVNLDKLTVHLAHYLENPREKIPVKSIICNENYSEMEHINDIAVLELENEITFFHPVKLVSEGFVCERDRQGVLVGWGLTEEGKIATVLGKVDVVAYDDASCANSHFGMYDMEKNMCAGWPEDGRGSCQGDSGGPLLIEGFQAGIISFGISSDCGISSREHPKVLTRISKYVEWIDENSKYGAGNYGVGVRLCKVLLLMCVFSLVG
ncbi:hypothetical protein Zmor_004851 [Zophobas morio]|uniref:Peptidase S1 domain-containing protein n=1 Tax=Zophobas morio TaxID=2755281 RepID=A0AA38IU82_9CUCU|nr:hypothetical protein Zmor_004851 [Zophobas morio]